MRWENGRMEHRKIFDADSRRHLVVDDAVQDSGNDAGQDDFDRLHSLLTFYGLVGGSQDYCCEQAILGSMSDMTMYRQVSPLCLQWHRAGEDIP